jgi:hypothetical protein
MTKGRRLVLNLSIVYNMSTITITSTTFTIDQLKGISHNMQNYLDIINFPLSYNYLQKQLENNNELQKTCIDKVNKILKAQALSKKGGSKTKKNRKKDGKKDGKTLLVPKVEGCGKTCYYQL